MFKKELLNYQDKLYFIERKIKESSVKPEFINDLKEYWECSIVLRQTNHQTNETYLFFLIEIEDAKVVED